MYSRVYPTGVVRYDPEKSWGGLTIVPSTFGFGNCVAKGAALYDMNGNTVQRWEGLYGIFDNKMLPGGDIIGCSKFAKGYWLDGVNVIQKDWDGNDVWVFNRSDQIPDKETGELFWSARAHHDFQREGSPVGYYSPGQEPKRRGKTLINSTETRDLPDLSPYPVADTKIIEVDEEGNILWKWRVYDHWDQLGIEPIAKAVLYYYAKPHGGADYVKEIYCNNINYVGPNKWYDAGDERFHPDNIITDIRIFNCAFIIDKKSGDIVWRIGPDFEYSAALQNIRQIVGLHHAHMIPKGLPGEGNVLLFDNGGQAGVGKPTPCSPTGYLNATRGYSRVIEIDPVSLEMVWTFNDEKLNFGRSADLSWANLLYSSYCASADRLPNGNTLITDTVHGRVIEVTPKCEIVWEFINPGHHVFRAHRYPYEWFPQMAKPEEIPVTPPENSRIRLTPEGNVALVEADPFFARGSED
ncbi:MAG: arylsulfotransferase family protein [Desulfatiglandaceae bacterium]